MPLPNSFSLSLSFSYFFLSHWPCFLSYIERITFRYLWWNNRTFVYYLSVKWNGRKVLVKKIKKKRQEITRKTTKQRHPWQRRQQHKHYTQTYQNKDGGNCAMVAKNATDRFNFVVRDKYAIMVQQQLRYIYLSKIVFVIHNCEQ